MDYHVGYESWVKRDHVMPLGFDPRVTAFASRRFWQRWPAGDGVRQHLSGYFARRCDGVRVVDVRP
jgi:hypothetical protein